MEETKSKEQSKNVSVDSHARQQAISQRERAVRTEGSYGESTVLSQLLSAIQENTVLYDQVTGVNSDKNGAYLILYRNDIEIRIPFELSSETLPEELLNSSVPSHINRQRMMLKKYVNVSLPYIPIQIKTGENGQYILASTVKAMNVIRYNKIIRNGIVKEGEPVDVLVLSVAKHAMYGMAHGVELHLVKRDTLLNYCDDLRSMYKPGQTITCKVTKLNVLHNNGMFDNSVEMMVSGRQWAIEEAIRKNKNKISRGAEFAGTIVSIKESTPGYRDPRPTYVITINGLNYPALCRDVYSGINLPEGTTLEPGDVVWTRVVGLNKNNIALVKITQVIKYI